MSKEGILVCMSCRAPEEWRARVDFEEPDEIYEGCYQGIMFLPDPHACPECEGEDWCYISD